MPYLITFMVDKVNKLLLGLIVKLNIVDFQYYPIPKVVLCVWDS